MHPTHPPASATHAANTDERLIRLDELLSITGESRTQAYENIKAGTHPAPLKDGRASVWVKSEVSAYVAGKVSRLRRKA